MLLQKTQSGVVQALGHVQFFVTPWTAAHQASLSFAISRNSFKLLSTEVVRPSNHFILCCPLFFLPSIFPSIRVWIRVSSSHQVAKVLEFQLQHQSFPMNIQGWFPLGWTGLISLQSKESSPASQSESINPLMFNLLWKLRDLGKKSIVILWVCGCVPLIQDLSCGLIHRESWWDGRILENVTYRLHILLPTKTKMYIHSPVFCVEPRVFLWDCWLVQHKSHPRCVICISSFYIFKVRWELKRHSQAILGQNAHNFSHSCVKLSPTSCSTAIV